MKKHLRIGLAVSAMAFMGLTVSNCGGSDSTEDDGSDGDGGGSGGSGGSVGGSGGKGGSGGSGSGGSSGKGGSGGSDGKGGSGGSDGKGGSGSGGSDGKGGSGGGTGGKGGSGGSGAMGGMGGGSAMGGMGGTAAGGMGGTAAGGMGGTAAEVTFTMVFDTILSKAKGTAMGCTGGCHSSPQGDAGVDFSDKTKAYASLTNTNEPMVVAGNAMQSKLYKVLVPGGSPMMPKGQSPLSADRVKLIADWINAGAKND